MKERFFHSFKLFDRVEMSERQTQTERRKNYESVGLSIIVVLFLAMAREPYAITVMFLLLLKKAVCFINKSSQANKILVRSSVNRSMGIYSH